MQGLTDAQPSLMFNHRHVVFLLRSWPPFDVRVGIYCHKNCSPVVEILSSESTVSKSQEDPSVPVTELSHTCLSVVTNTSNPPKESVDEYRSGA